MPAVQFCPQCKQGYGRGMDTGLRARKKRETRARLIAAAMDLAAERDVDDVTVADIAARADVSRRTFFNYFSSKEQALVGSSPERAGQLADLVAARPADEDAWNALRAALADLYATDDQRTDRSWVSRVRLARAHPSLVGELREYFAHLEGVLAAEVARRMGDRPDGLHPHLVVALAMTTIRVAIDHWLQQDDDSPLPAAIDAAMALVADDLLTPAAPTRILT